MVSSSMLELYRKKKILKISISISMIGSQSEYLFILIMVLEKNRVGPAFSPGLWYDGQKLVREEERHVREQDE